VSAPNASGSSLRPRLLAAAAGAVAGAVAYAAGYEVRAYQLRRLELPLLAPGAAPLRILHLSDLHLSARQRRKQAWLASLAAEPVDLVVDTGDNITAPDALPALVDALDGLLDRPGVFVSGSNDYHAPTPRNPARYLRGPSARREYGPPLPWEDLVATLSGRGWVHVDNRRARLDLNGRIIEVVGVDDPHIDRDRYDEVAGPPAPDAELTLGVVHAPYRRVLDRMVADGVDLVLAGHTHGGQLRVPAVGALVTNCDLERSRARGLSRHVVTSPYGTATGWLHVSAGLGTSPYAPIRFACRPEVTLLTLTARTEPEPALAGSRQPAHDRDDPADPVG
jgi:predicted MPP superfamily phosphohydrolase